MNWAGTERARSEYMFHLQVGSHEDESVLLARHVRAIGATRVAVVFDRSPIGRRYGAFFEAECDALGLELAARVPIGPLATDATAEVAALRPRPAPMCWSTSAWDSWPRPSAGPAGTRAGASRRS